MDGRIARQQAAGPLPVAADPALPTLLDRPGAVSPVAAPRPTPTTDRGPGGKTIQSRRTPSVQPPAFATPAKPSVTASEPSAPPRSAIPAIPAPRPWVESPSAATEAPPRAPAAAPGVPVLSAAPIERNDDETEPAEHPGDEPRGAGPAASDDVSPAPSNPEAPAPSGPAP